MFYNGPKENVRYESENHLRTNLHKYQHFLDDGDYGYAVTEALTDYYTSKIEYYRESGDYRKMDPEFNAYLDLLTEIMLSDVEYEKYLNVTSTQFSYAAQAVLKKLFHGIQ